MRRTVCILTMGWLSLAASQSAQAALITGVYGFASGDATVPSQANMNYGAFSRVGVAAGTLSGWFASSGWAKAGVVNTAQYVQFVLTPSSGYSLGLQSMTFDDIRNSKGPANGEVQIFLGSGLTLMGTQTFTPGTSSTSVSFDFADFSTANAQPVTIRFYGWNAFNGGNDNDLSFDNVAFTGSVNPVPEPVNVALGIFAAVVIVANAARTERLRELFCRA
jgi:hypothetical protein